MPAKNFLVVRDSAPAEALRGAVVAIGNFDGVHRGHRAVIGVAQDLARKRGTRPGSARHIKAGQSSQDEPKKRPKKLPLPDCGQNYLSCLNIGLIAIDLRGKGSPKAAGRAA